MIARKMTRFKCELASVDEAPNAIPSAAEWITNPIVVVDMCLFPCTNEGLLCIGELDRDPSLDRFAREICDACETGKVEGRGNEAFEKAVVFKLVLKLVLVLVGLCGKRSMRYIRRKPDNKAGPISECIETT